MKVNWVFGVFLLQFIQARQLVNIFHIIDNALWGEVDGSFLQGNFNCGKIECNVYSSDSLTDFFTTARNKYHMLHKGHLDSPSLPLLLSKENFNSNYTPSLALSVSLYNIHTWKMLSKWPHGPDKCRLPTNLSMAESEESFGRFGHLFDHSFPLFDGYSTTHPLSSVPRSYLTLLNASLFFPEKLFSTLIKGAVFVASTCHRERSTLSSMKHKGREGIVQEIMASKIFRVDSLGKCLHTSTGPEGIVLTSGSTPQESLHLKQTAISHYLFYFAFENTIEAGYVTEKIFDALIAGVVPVYLGDVSSALALLPSPLAAIFLHDYQYNVSALVDYLLLLSHNETQYNLHRAWRQDYVLEYGRYVSIANNGVTSSLLHSSASTSVATSFSFMSPLLLKSWPCRICEWAVNTTFSKKKIAASSQLDYRTRRNGVADNKFHIQKKNLMCS